MSCTVELQVDQALLDKFKACREGKDVRYLKIEIKDEKVVLAGEGAGTSDPKADIEGLKKCTSEDPYYAVVRTESSAPEWVFLTYIPDTTKVKVKMLYATSLGHVKRQLGSIAAEKRVDEADEVCWATIEQAVEAKKGGSNTDAMTEQEKESAAAAKELASVTGSSGAAYAHSVNCKVGDGVKNAIKSLSEGEAGCVILKIDGEEIGLDKVGKEGESIEDVMSSMEKGESRYIVFRHKGDGDEAKVFFIYFCSDQCPVKKRMLYASMKGAAIHHTEEGGCKIDKTLEFSDPADITTEAIKEALCGPKGEADAESPTRKAKPKGAGRGPRMLI